MSGLPVDSEAAAVTTQRRAVPSLKCRFGISRCLAHCVPYRNFSLCLSHFWEQEQETSAYSHLQRRENDPAQAERVHRTVSTTELGEKCWLNRLCDITVFSIQQGALKPIRHANFHFVLNYLCLFTRGVLLWKWLIKNVTEFWKRLVHRVNKRNNATLTNKLKESASDT